ncbi:MAG: hypothetical protein IJL71_00715 [Oscillospiraceae bacterium]|nr:hypothetical protein [Oscillospiraceae bacterium]
MKRIIVLIIALLLLFSGCTRKKPEYDNPMTPEILLPDFTVKEQSDHFVVYEDVHPYMLGDYIHGLSKAGFKYEEYMSQSFLYRDDVYIIICRWAEPNEITIEYRIGQPTESEGALTWSEAIGAIGDERLLSLAEATPEGLYDATGAQVFFGPVYRPNLPDDTVPDEPEYRGYETRAFLVGKNGGCMFRDFLAGPVYGDIDRDGKDEIVFLSDGPISGIFTVVINVYSVENGVPVELAEKTYAVDSVAPELKTDENGNILIEHTPINGDTRQAELTLENGEIALSEEIFRDWPMSLEG